MDSDVLQQQPEDDELQLSDLGRAPTQALCIEKDLKIAYSANETLHQGNAIGPKNKWAVPRVDMRGLQSSDPAERRVDQIALNKKRFVPYACRQNSEPAKRLRSEPRISTDGLAVERSVTFQAADRPPLQPRQVAAAADAVAMGATTEETAMVPVKAKFQTGAAARARTVVLLFVPAPRRRGATPRLAPSNQLALGACQ